MFVKQIEWDHMLLLSISWYSFYVATVHFTFLGKKTAFQKVYFFKGKTEGRGRQKETDAVDLRLPLCLVPPTHDLIISPQSCETSIVNPVFQITDQRTDKTWRSYSLWSKDLIQICFVLKSMYFLLQYNDYYNLVPLSNRSYPKMVAFMVAHSSQSLIENIHAKQWKLNEHSKERKKKRRTRKETHTEAAHVKAYIYTHSRHVMGN